MFGITHYGRDGPRLKPRWEKLLSLLHTRPDGPRYPNSLPYSEHRGCFPRGKEAGYDLDHPPLLSTKFSVNRSLPPFRLCASTDMLRGDRYLYPRFEYKKRHSECEFSLMLKESMPFFIFVFFQSL